MQIIKEIPLELAPMEGCTGYVYRKTFHKYFSGVDKYYTPFLSANHNFRFKKRELKEVSPSLNEGMHLVPQIITNNAEQFVWSCEKMADLGYREVNLNAGCPAGTVFAKRKGSGMLYDLADYEDFLNAVFRDLEKKKVPVAVSVKTRIGVSDTEDLEYLMELYNKYPISELIIHPRVREDYYKKPIRIREFLTAKDMSKNPVCYNGDIAFFEEESTFYGNTKPEIEKLISDESLAGIMCGRGALRDPSLFRRLRGGERLTHKELSDFMNELWQEYCIEMDSPGNAMFRMKELWGYTAMLFNDVEKPLKAIRKAKNPDVYVNASREILQNHPFIWETF